jgi:hypothetical protein
MVGAGLKGDISGSAFDGDALFSRVAQGHDFGVGATGFLGVALAQDAP